LYIVNTKQNYTYDCLQADIEALCREYHFLEVFSIGESVCGRKLSCLSFGNGKRKLFLNGAHHGMEWITSLLLMRMLEEFCHRKQSGTAIGRVDLATVYHNVSLVICPMVNPDGVELSLRGLSEPLPPLTKTRLLSYNKDSHDFSKWQANINGIDLNHNYDADFDLGVMHQSRLGIYGPAPTRFSGPHPESEPESKAVADFTRHFRPDIAVAYHSQGQVIYHDFNGLETEQSKEIAANMATISGYELDQTDGIASCSGYKDWVIKTFRIPAFTIEVGLGENPLPLSCFDTIFEDNLRMLLYLVSI